MNVYTPILDTWSARYLVTLTVPNCSGEDLRETFGRMGHCFTLCKRAMKRAGFALLAMRKLECTYNTRRRDYHPHYHVIVDGEAEARELRRLWLHYWPGSAAEAQDVRACDGGSLAEVFKYFTKLVAPGAGGKRGVMPLEALDTIFRAMRGRRVWQPVGFRLSKEEAESIEGEVIEVTGTQAFKRTDERVLWDWCHDAADWIDRETGESLSEYEPGTRFRAFVESIGTGAGGMAAAVDDG
jgi:hypothetical protein